MKRFFTHALSALFTLLAVSSVAQNEGNMWCFGNFAGLDFNSGTPAPFTTGMSQIEGCASIADASGNLLFYTSGLDVWDATHTVMPNGTGLMGGTSSTQSGVIVPHPGSPTTYYIFTADQQCGANGVRYSVVDMTANGGLGDVTTKNVLLFATASEKITAVQHANGTDYWVVAHDCSGSTYYAYLVEASGVNPTPVTSNVGIQQDWPGIGYMKVSPNGAWIAAALWLQDSLEILSFDNNTGMLSSPFLLQVVPREPYGVEFSPSGQYLYVGYFLSAEVWQFDMLAGSPGAIEASGVLIASVTGGSTGALQVAPDGKIYLAKGGSGTLDVINDPDIGGTSCNYVPNQTSLGGNTCMLGLPTFVQSFFSSSFYCDMLCYGDSTQFFMADTTGIDSVYWDFGDLASGSDNFSSLIEPKHVFSDTGGFQVTLTAWKAGTSSTFSKHLLVLPQPAVSLSNDTILCLGDTLHLDVSFPYVNYQWQDGSDSSGFQVTTADIYWVSLSNACGGATDSIVVDYYPALTVDLGNDTAICAADSLVLNASAPLSTYLWQDGSTDSTLTATAAGTYFVEVTDLCETVRDTIVITHRPDPIVNLGSDTVLCDSLALILDATNPYATYLWQDGSTAPTYGAQSSGTYWVTVDNECTQVTDSVDIFYMPTVTINLGADTTICSFDSLTFSVSHPLTSYQWSTGDTSTSITSHGGILWVLATNVCETKSDTIEIDVLAPPQINLGNDTAYCIGSTHTLDATTDSATYLWHNGQTTSTITADNGLNWVEVTNVCGTDRDSINVIISSVSVSAGPDANLCAGDSVQLGATSPNTISTWHWTPSNGLGGSSVADPTASPLTTTAYTITATDSIGCYSTDDVVVTVYSLPPVDAGPDTAICFGVTISLNASGASSYQWSTNPSLSCTSCQSPAATPQSSTQYYVTGTDLNGCQLTDSVQVTINPLPLVLISPDSTICDGESVQLDVQGPTGSQYYWNVGTPGLDCYFCPNPIASPSTTTTYSVAVEDNNTCTTDTSVTITVNPVPAVNAGPDVAICDGSSITLSATGASSYNWQPGGLSAPSISVSPTSTTQFIVTGTNSFGCEASDTVVVTVNPLPSVSAGADQTICALDSATLAATGAASYTWQPGALLGATVTVGPATTTVYSVVGIDANGCINHDSVTVTVNPLPVLTASATDTVLCAGQSTTLSAAGANSYQWTPGGTGATISTTPIATTTYLVTGTDSNGCKDSETITVTVNPLPPVTATASPPDICVGQNATLNATGASSYVWQPSGQTSSSFVVSPSSTEVHTVTGTDANGCQAVSSVTVTVHPLPNVDAGPDQTICSGDQATLSATGALTYNWAPGGPGATIQVSPGTSTTYNVTGTDAWGCQNFDALQVIVNPLPVVQVNPANICAGDDVVLSATGALSYLWKPGNLSGDSVLVAPLTTTVYTVVGTDANSCASTGNATVTVRSICPEKDPVLGIPTAFTPNSDGLNDVFKIERTENFDLILLQVFNRWGEVLFETRDINDGWDGNYRGEPQPIGSFVYTILGSDYIGRPVRYRGNLTLLR